MKLTPKRERELLLTNEEINKLNIKYIEVNDDLIPYLKVQLTHTFEVLEQKGYSIVKVDEKLKNNIAECFKVARKEGALTKWADGISDAEDVIALIEGEK